MNQIKDNPWSVESFDDFLFYCCPECDERNQSKDLFIKHALIHHPEAQKNLVALDTLDIKKSESINDNAVFEVKTEIKEEDVEDGDQKDDNTDINHSNSDSKRNDKQRSFQCTTCNKYFGNYANLHRHIKSIHDGKRFECDYCQKSFTQSGYLKIHVRNIHLGLEDIQVCPNCNKIFESEQDLLAHIQLDHGEVKKDEQKESLKNDDATYNQIPSNSSKDHKCDICGRHFSELQTLNLHIASIHEKKGEYNCDSCQKSFGTLTNLQRHINSIHHGQKHSCTSCQKSFTQESYLKIHISKIHEGLSNAQLCQYCNKMFRNEIDLVSLKYTTYFFHFY